MAVMVPSGFAGLTSAALSPTNVRLRRRRIPLIPSAALSSQTRATTTTTTVQKEAADWVEATSSFFQNDSRPIMLFDGVCNLCNGGVKFVRDNDRQRRIRLEALQSEAGKKLLRRCGRAPDDISSVVLVEKDRSYIKSEAVLKIMENIDLPYPRLAFVLQFVPPFVRDFFYDKVANNRYAFFGRSDSCDL